MKKLTFSMSLVLIITLTGCTGKMNSDLNNNNIIPRPRSVTSTSDYFSLNKKVIILVPKQDELLKNIGRYLTQELAFFPGTEAMLRTTKSLFPKQTIELIIDSTGTIKDKEAYKLKIDKRKISLSASSAEGIFRGIQSLRQLIILNSREVGSGSLGIPTGEITDYPEFEYRGVMLDVARHFFGMEDIKRYIELVSLYKINVLHLHLSDDQGWRIEIKSWPKLTEVGSLTQVGGGKGGFYSQDEYNEIVKYAADRFITIIPEIDMPGHINAALASYPELNCDNKTTELYTGTRVGFSNLCTVNEITYKFIDDVIAELALMTPGPYIHIGGDESHATALKDYIPFINRVQDIIASHGKTMIGWDEISHAGLKSGSVVQYWGSEENAKRGIAKGAKLILSPASKCYLDMQYDSSSVMGLNWAGYIEVYTAYTWSPVDLFNGLSRENIIGIESPLWTETVETMDNIEYMVFPRLIGHAEIGWSDPEPPDWEEYKNRLGKHSILLDMLDIDFYRSPFVNWE